MYDKHRTGLLEEDWRYERDENGVIIKVYCKTCHSRLIHNPKYNPDRHKKYNPRRLSYKGQIILLDHDPKTGVCNLCRAVVPFDCKKTGMHHFSYSDNDPLADTIEICQKCHRTWHWEFNRNGKFIPN